jgi:hypothetical protein
MLDQGKIIVIPGIDPESRKRESWKGGIIYRDEGDKGDNYLDSKPRFKGQKKNVINKRYSDTISCSALVHWCTGALNIIHGFK